MAENSADVVVGSLLEVRADAGYKCPEDVDAVFQSIGRALMKLPPGAPHVTVVDWRHCPLMAPDAAKHMLELIQGTNANTTRSAALASPDSPSAVLQFVRLIREADLPDRKLFTDRDELYDWLAETLTNDERLRLKAFLAEGAGRMR